MLAEVAQLEPRLKEILYRCLEQIKATKAALYITAGEAGYDLITHYGFANISRQHLTINDVVVDRLNMRRAAFLINGLANEPRFSELMYDAGTDRMMVAPIYGKGRLIGFLDMRDKAGKLPFEPGDAPKAKAIVDDILDLFTQKNLFGLQPINLANVVSLQDEASEAPAVVTRVIEMAQQFVNRELLRLRTISGGLTESDIAAISAALPPILSLPGAQIAAYSAFGHLGNVQAVVAKSTVTDEALQHFESKLLGWLRKRGELEQACRSEISYPLGTTGPTINPTSLTTILSAPVSVPSLRGLVLTVGFDTPPDIQTKKLLETFLRMIEQATTHAMSHNRFSNTRQKIVERLLEPDFQKYPDLVEHSKRVSGLADQFAHHLGLSAGDVETIRISALVHDVGMRLLDYHRLYRKPSFTTGDLAILRDHTIVGAAMVEPLLGAEIANIVLTHHERPDGKGYPHGIAGEQIPFATRVIQICDAFDAMTAPNSYQTPLSETAALERILQAAGAHFDFNLAKKFIEMVG